MNDSNSTNPAREFDLKELRQLISARGRMSRILPGFRHRQEQEDLLVRIAEAFRADEFLLAEAGTGVGKSLAYLIPAAYWAHHTGKRVVVSTRTKTLQQQLVNEELPRLQEVLPFKFSYELAKGRENYLCRNRLANLVAKGRDLTGEQKEFLQRAVVWAAQTQSGDRQELKLDSRLLAHWGLVACERRGCWRERCPFQDSCFRQQMIRRLEKADLIVVNHALLLADARLGKGVLPEYQYLVIDEAHNLEREAFDKLATTFSLHETKEALYSLAHRRQKVQVGLLAALQTRYPHLKSYLDEAKNVLEKALQALEGFFAALSRHLTSRAAGGGQSVRWTGPFDTRDEVCAAYLVFDEAMQALAASLQPLQEEVEDKADYPDLESVQEQLQEILGDARYIITECLEDPEQVVWVNFYAGQAMAVFSSPLRVGEALDENLYQNLNSMVMVSATLTVAGGFGYFIERNGLADYARDGRLATIARPSPFDYDHCCRVYLVNDMPAPGQPDFNSQVNEFLGQFLPAIPGRTLVLFTSRSMLQEAAGMLRTTLGKQGITLLVQHQDGDPASLLDELVACGRCVLMGVDTFWEGVDLRGEYLTCLVMVKLPFRSPADPLTLAWNDHYRANGENGFHRLLLPDAILRFKQGVGRLIRSESDWGAVVITDRRMAAPPWGKSYGSLFVRSLPGGQVVETDRASAGREVRNWLVSFSPS